MTASPYRKADRAVDKTTDTALHLPPSLREGGTIGVMAPSSRTDYQAVDRAIAFLEENDYRVRVHPQVWSEDGQSAGTPAEKADALHDLLRDPDIDAVFFARGGNRAGHMLPHLDFRLIRRAPKIMMGYSDATILLNTIHRKTGLVTFHGPVLQRFAKPLPPDQVRQCFDMLAGKKTAIDMSACRVLRPGSARGPLLGGNLSLVCSMAGTKWQPRWDGAVLFLEDCADELSRYDRMFLQLRHAGILERIGGLVLGAFTDTRDTGALPFGFTLEDIVMEATEGLGIPVVSGAPFGHGADLVTLPVGGVAGLTARNGKTGVRLTLAGKMTV